MKPLPISDVFEAAAYAVVGGRCRQAHLHDARGELQTLQSAIELLTRAAKTPGDNTALADKASALAKRALAAHEKSLVELLNRMTPQDAAMAPLNLGRLVSEALRILRNDALSKSIEFRFEALADVSIEAQPNLCQMVILGLCAVTIDELAPGAAVTVTVGRVDGHAYVGWKSETPWPAVGKPDDLRRCARDSLSPYELLLAVAWQWAAANGGRLELPEGPQVRDAMRIYYPIHGPGA